jgi:hypothetical protein
MAQRTGLICHRWPWVFMWFATIPAQRKTIQDFFCSLAGRQEEVRQLCAIKTVESFLALL